MGQRLLPQNLIELYAHALAIERDAFKRFVELERIGREEQEQYEALAEWEYAWHYLGPQSPKAAPPKSAREALSLALATERRAQNFYPDVAEHAPDDALCAFAAEMATDEQRHVQRLEELLAREPLPAKIEEDDAELVRR